MKLICFYCNKHIKKNKFMWLKLDSGAMTKICRDCVDEIIKNNSEILTENSDNEVKNE